MHVLIDYHAKCSLTGLDFQYYSKNELLKLSVKEITKPQALDRLLNPIQNGLYDLALGPLDKNDICLTCNLDYFQCPGHFGHINLALPVYNPVFFKELIRLLRSSCLSCHQLLTSRLEKDYFLARMKLISHGLVEQLPLLADLYSKILNNSDSRLIGQISFKNDFEDLVRFVFKTHQINESSPSSPVSHGKNVFKAKQDVIKEFMDVKLKASRQTCTNCGMPLRQLRAEHHSKLFYAKGISNRVLNKNKQAKRVPTTRMNQEDEPVDELDVQMASEDNNNKEEEERIEDEEQQLENLTGQAYLTPVECRKHLNQIAENEKDIFYLLIGILNFMDF